MKKIPEVQLLKYISTGWDLIAQCCKIEKFRQLKAADKYWIVAVY